MKARCSQLDRLALCSASARMEKGRPDEQSFDSSEGTMLHEVMAGKKHELTAEQEETVGYAEGQWKQLLEGVFPNQAPKIQNEQEFGMIIGGHELTGHVDRIAYSRGNFLMVDWKMGRNPVPASQQIQLRGYALLLRDCLMADRVTAAIIQPRLGKAGTTAIEVTDWDAELNYITSILDAAEKDDAPFNPSEAACKYCRARGDCPAALKVATDIAKAPPAWAALKAEDKAAVLETCDLLDTLITKYREQAKNDLLADPQALGGLWELTEGRERREVTDAQAAYGKLAGTLNAETFAACCKIKISSLETAYRKALNLKVKEAKEQLAEQLDGLIEVTKTAPSLKRVK